MTDAADPLLEVRPGLDIASPGTTGLDLTGLRPLLAPPIKSIRASEWWLHAPFLRFLLLAADPRSAAGEGEGFMELRELALGAGMAMEWKLAPETPADLLMLDGSWDEAAAVAALAIWRARLKPGAAALVHGINPGRGGSVLWAAWLSDQPSAPRLAFTHGAGLGLVLQADASVPALRALCALPQPDAAAFAALCAALGERWGAQQRHLTDAAAIVELTRDLESARRRSERARRRCDGLVQEIAGLQERADALTDMVAQQAAEISVRSELLTRQSQEFAGLAERAAALERAHLALTLSTSWRVARTFAGVAGRLPSGFRVLGRRAARLTWWLMTGRLGSYMRRRRTDLRRAALLRASPLFDAAWYERAYSDVGPSRLEPSFHFAAYGAAENRSPGPGFDIQWYRDQYQDVAAAGIHPLLHYLEFGAAQGRQWRPVPQAIEAPMSVAPPALPTLAPPQHLAVGWNGQGAAIASEASAVIPAWSRPVRRVIDPRGLGRDLPAVTILPVVVGFAMRTTPMALLQRALESAAAALEGIGQRRPGSVLVADDYATVAFAPLTPWDTACLPARGKPGFAAAHNRLMEAAFTSGAEVYVAAHPAGDFAPDSLIALLRMVRANGRRVIVEATRSPQPVPKPVGAAPAWAVPWSSGACLAIPRRVYEATGGFDERLASWGADIDYGWRARASGFPALACPDAVFELPFRDGGEEAVPVAYLSDAFLLARKWQLFPMEAHLRLLLAASGQRLPDAQPTALPEAFLRSAELPGVPFFGDALW